MDTRLNELFPELLNVKNFIDSDEKIDPIMDSVVGVLPDCLRALYTLLRLSEQSMHSAVIRSKTSSDYGSDDIIKHICGVCESSKKYESLRTIFKVLARNAFGLWDDKCCSRLGVRQGFLLVKPFGHKPERMVLSGTPEEIFQKLKEAGLKKRFCSN